MQNTGQAPTQQEIEYFHLKVNGGNISTGAGTSRIFEIVVGLSDWVVSFPGCDYAIVLSDDAFKASYEPVSETQTKPSIPLSTPWLDEHERNMKLEISKNAGEQAIAGLMDRLKPEQEKLPDSELLVLKKEVDVTNVVSLLETRSGIVELIESLKNLEQEKRARQIIDILDEMIKLETRI